MKRLISMAWVLVHWVTWVYKRVIARVIFFSDVPISLDYWITTKLDIHKIMILHFHNAVENGQEEASADQGANHSIVNEDRAHHKADGKGDTANNKGHCQFAVSGMGSLFWGELRWCFIRHRHTACKEQVIKLFCVHFTAACKAITLALSLVWRCFHGARSEIKNLAYQYSRKSKVCELLAAKAASFRY